MATVNVMSVEGAQAGTVDLDAGIFEAEARGDLLHAEVRRQLADRRSGTHQTKNRHAVSGGGSKPWRQKGTGRARQGSSRSPQWAGGGVVFGPVPRDYTHKLTKKVRQAALRSALSTRVAEGKLIVLESLSLDEYKTKRVAELLGKLEAGRALIVIGEADAKIEASARNIDGVSAIRAEGLNVYDVLRHESVVITKDALAKVEARLAKKSGGAS